MAAAIIPPYIARYPKGTLSIVPPASPLRLRVDDVADARFQPLVQERLQSVRQGMNLPQGHLPLELGLQPLLEVGREEGHPRQMIHGDVEKSLDLSRVEVRRDHAVRAAVSQEAGQHRLSISGKPPYCLHCYNLSNRPNC